MGLYELDGVRVRVPAGDDWYIADNAIVLGNVSLEPGASVWFGAVLRGDNEPIVIGARSNIQDGCVLHTDPGFPMHIGEDATIGHMVMLHGCTIGRGSLVGIGAIILNGAKIGEDCLIGAGALIPEGKVIPDRSVVFGSPGKIVREVKPEDIARMQAGARHYHHRAQQYRRGFKPQG